MGTDVVMPRPNMQQNLSADVKTVAGLRVKRLVVAWECASRKLTGALYASLRTGSLAMSGEEDIV